jgi:RNA-binding protein
MITQKQKATLKGLANSIHQRYLIGKGEVDDNIVKLLDTALESHELIKVGVLQNSEVDVDDLAASLAKKLSCDVVQTIGRVIVLYRKSKKNPRIVL